MIVYPAIDLKDGQCVRLYKGDMNRAMVFHDTPAEQAAVFADQGCQWLHIVDLNGAFAGRSENGQAVRAILERVDVPVQLGGGIRDLRAMETWLDMGVSRLILGTLAVKNPNMVWEACRQFPGKIAVGIDARDGRVAVEGWAETSDMAVTDLARQFEDAGVAALIFTDIDRDGTLEGVNVDATAQLAAAVDLPVIASGGVRGLDDLTALRDVAAQPGGSGINGVIVGRALYDGGMDLTSALQLVRGAGRA